MQRLCHRSLHARVDRDNFVTRAGATNHSAGERLADHGSRYRSSRKIHRDEQPQKAEPSGGDQQPG
jgi:hypothetical protein